MVATGVSTKPNTTTAAASIKGCAGKGVAAAVANGTVDKSVSAPVYETQTRFVLEKSALFLSTNGSSEVA
jgi:hypothetical protein